jgi:hypothetical protein
VQEYQSSELRQYFKEDALLYPIETIIGKSFVIALLKKLSLNLKY